jgi:ribonuclease HI
MTTYYVVHKGKKPGIYSSWNECKKQVDKFDGAIFKKFSDKKDAELFLKEGFGENKKPRSVTRKENDDKKNNTKIIDETIDDDTEKIFIYTDGSCIKFKNNISKGGFGIYIPEKNIEVSMPLLNQKITNNRAEMTAIIDSIKYLDHFDLLKKICIFTDSQYSMYIFNGTGERYEQNGYKNDGKDVPNIDLIKKMLELKRNYNIVLLKVRAHTDKKDKHSIGNEVADKLAQKGALSKDDSSNIFTRFTLEENNNEEKIDKNIQMNELFEFDEDDGLGLEIKKKGRPTKNPKLSNWFIKM